MKNSLFTASLIISESTDDITASAESIVVEVSKYSLFGQSHTVINDESSFLRSKENKQWDHTYLPSAKSESIKARSMKAFHFTLINLFDNKNTSRECFAPEEIHSKLSENMWPSSAVCDVIFSQTNRWLSIEYRSSNVILLL